MINMYLCTVKCARSSKIIQKTYQLMNKKTFLLATLLMTVMLSLQAVPAYRQAVQRTQPDGSVVTVVLQGDEHRHLLRTTDGHALAQDADGWLRYARLEQGRLTSEGAPVAHDEAQRSTAERSYVSQLQPIALESLPETRVPALPRRAPQGFGGGNEVIQIGSFPTQGEIRALIILAEFADVKFSTEASYISSIMNEEGYTGSTVMGSARDYFIQQSGGQFRPSFDVVGPVTLNHQMKYYGGNNFWGSDERAEFMIRDACTQAHSELGVDFSQYDYDNDGKVDMVYVIYAGYGENYGASEDCVWPHKYDLSAQGINLKLDDKQVDTYACSCELIGYQGTEPSGIGTFCHEFSHVLGLADHYDTNSSSRMMLGRYDLMDYGCYNDLTHTPCGYTSFERYSVQWMELEEIDEPADSLTLENVATSYHAYKLQSPNENEYYLLETRLQEGWDAFIPGQGLMITHVKYDRGMWSQNVVNNGTDPGYCLVPADGVRSYDDDATDLFPLKGYGIDVPSVIDFTDESVPSQQTYDGKPTNRWVTNIRFDNGVVSFDFMNNAVGRTQTLPVDRVWRHGFTAEWTPAVRADHYSIELYRYDTLRTRPVMAAEDFELFSAGSYSNPDVTELSTNLDAYMNQPGWTGDRICQAGGMARIGGANTSGQLTSPTMDLSKSGGCFTVVVKAQGYTGKNPVFSIMSNGYEAKHRLSASQKEYIYIFPCGTSETKVSFITNKERVYVDDLYIKRGNASAEHPNASLIEVTPPMGADPIVPDEDSDLTDLAFDRVLVTSVDSIQDCWYAFTDLLTDRSYGFIVRAWRGDVSSEPCPEVMVELLSTMGIESLEPETNETGRCAVYDLEGHRVASDRLTKGRLYLTTDGQKFIVR